MTDPRRPLSAPPALTFDPPAHLDLDNDWDLGGREYDPSRFYTKTSDSHGHSSNPYQVKVTPGMESICQQIVAAFPQYRSLQSFIRDAMTHRAFQLQALMQEGKIDMTVLELEMRAAEVDALEANMTWWEETIQKLDRVVERCIDRGDLSTAEYHLDMNCDGEGMTPSYANQLAGVVEKHRARITGIWERMAEG